MTKQLVSSTNRTLAISLSGVFLASLVSTALNTVVGLFLVRALLPIEFGMVAYFLRLFGLARFIGNVGLGAKIIEDVSTSLINGDTSGVNRTVYSLGLFRAASVFIIVALSILSFVLTQDSVYLWLALIAPISSFLDHTTAIAQGLRRRSLIMLTTVLQPLLYFVFLISIALSSALNPGIIYSGLSLSFLLTLIICLVALKQNILFPQKHFISFAYLKQSLTKLVSLFVLGLFSQLALSVSTVILGQLGQFEHAAYFNAGFNLVLIPITVSSIVITSVFYPEFVSFTKSGKKPEAAQLLQNFIEWIFLLLALCVVGLVIYADTVVSVLYPADYEATVAVMIILAPFVLFGTIQSLLNFALIALDKVKHAIWIQVLQTLIIIVGTYASVSLPANQVSLGIALTYTASLLIVILLMWISVRQAVPVHFAAKNILAFSLLAMLCVVIPYQLISLISIDSLILSSSLSAIVSLASYLLILVIIFKGHHPRLKNLLTSFSMLLLMFTVYGISQAGECAPARRIESVHLLLCTVDPSSGTNVYIYSQKETSQSDSVKDNVLLFDANGDGTAQLIIRFDSTPSTVTANIFLDQNADGNVEYVITDESFTVNEGIASIFLTETYPSVKVTAKDDWYLPNGELNWNVIVETDGPQVYDVDTRVVELHGIVKRVWQRDMVLDGIPDTVWEYRDDDLDGIPEYGLWRLLTAASSNRNAARTWLWVNYERLKADASPHFLMWPYLFSTNTFSVEIISQNDNSTDEGFTLPESANPYIGKSYFETQFFFEIDWQTAKISPPMFVGYPIEDGFHVHSLNKFEKNSTNYANFENIQAYYDLAEDDDNRPELHIRQQYYAEEDRVGGNLPLPLSNFRWSWNQWNSDALNWHYKLDVVGSYPIDKLIQFPDFSYYSLDYEELPYWVTDRTWFQASFVATEQRTYLSTEGIYDWSSSLQPLLDQNGNVTDNLQMSRYLAGEVVADPRTAFSSIQPGLRGEFAPELFAQPYLYFSPIDSRLHLKGAEFCIWQVDTERVIRCNDLDKDGYFDHWQYTAGDQTSDLYYTDAYLVLEQAGSVIIREAETSPVLFETLPPRNYDEWINLQIQLATHHRDVDAGDFAALISEFPGEEWTIQGAAIQSFRHLPHGFRLVLRFPEPTSAPVRIPGVEMVISNAGDYAVIYENGSWRVEENSSSKLVWSALQLGHETVEQGRPVPVSVTVSNQSNADAHGIRYLITAAWGETSVEIASGEVDVLAGESLEIATTWTAEHTGTWALDLSTEMTSLTSQVEVKARPIAVSDLLSLDQMLPLGGMPVFLSLGGLVTVAVGLFVLIVRSIKKPV